MTEMNSGMGKYVVLIPIMPMLRVEEPHKMDSGSRLGSGSGSRSCQESQPKVASIWIWVSKIGRKAVGIQIQLRIWTGTYHLDATGSETQWL